MVVLQLGDPPIVKGLRPTIVPGGILVESFQWGSISATSGLSGASRATVHDVTLFVKGENVSATDILRLSVKGTAMAVAKMSVLSSAKTDSSGFQMVLSDVIVASASTSGIDVTFTLNFRDSEQRFMMVR